VGLLRALRRMERLAGRFNRWIGPTAVAAQATGDEGRGKLDPVSTAAILEEIEQSAKKAEKDT
jgi:hypothetical protein